MQELRGWKTQMNLKKIFSNLAGMIFGAIFMMSSSSLAAPSSFDHPDSVTLPQEQVVGFWRKYTLPKDFEIQINSCNRRRCRVSFEFGGRSVSISMTRSALGLPEIIRRRGGIHFASVTCDCVKTNGCEAGSGYGPRRRPQTNGGRRGSAMHQGVDVKGGAGTAIIAAESGNIIFSGRKGGYGNTIEIDHGSGWQTRYAHMSRIEVRSGWVNQGQVIGYMGSTGNVSGPHLHFEMRKDGETVDPALYMSVGSVNLSQTCESRAGGAGRRSRSRGESLQ